MFNFLKYRKIYFVFSAILVLASLAALVVFGLKPGIDFTGGSILELEYANERPSIETIKGQLTGIDLGSFNVQTVGENGIIIRAKDISEATHQQILRDLKLAYMPPDDEGVIEVIAMLFEEQRFESIGPVIGQELKQKTKWLIGLSLLLILAYIAFAFRRVSRPARSWQYGIASLLALCHDVLVPLGIFAVLGKLFNIEISIPIIAGLLTVLGYSINNTVVVFDRIRENLIRGQGMDFENTMDISLNQTLTRSINTSLTTLLVLLAIFFFGGITLKYFSLALIMGIAAGTYSSLFLAGPILVSWLRWRQPG